MNRRIAKQDLETEIRSYLADAGAVEPPSLGDVLDRLPDRSRAPHRSFAQFSGLPRFAALATVLILAAAAVGLPLILTRAGPVASSPSGVPATPIAPAHSGTFVPTGSMSTGRDGCTATLLSDGRVLVAGGGNLASAELYDPLTGKFSPTGSMTTARTSHTATLLSDGRVLIAGGVDNTGNVASAEIYDPGTGKFSATGSMTVARASQTATIFPNGRVLISGGQGGNGMALASAELYDPVAGTFSATGSMTVARMIQSATLLPSGRVLISGGWTTTLVSSNDRTASILASAELYDPATGTFGPTGSMATARSAATTTLLPDGRVLVAGGIDQSGVGLTSAELYDPATGTFGATGSMISGRSKAAAVSLPNGLVLVAGGWGGAPPPPVYETPLASAELYDPTTGTFSPTGSMSAGRGSPMAILLRDGRVLIDGGADKTGNVASAELYQP